MEALLGWKLLAPQGLSRAEAGIYPAPNIFRIDTKPALPYNHPMSSTLNILRSRRRRRLISSEDEYERAADVSITSSSYDAEIEEKNTGEAADRDQAAEAPADNGHEKAV